MNLSSVKNLITSKAGRQLLVMQKNSPTILFAAGIVGVVGTVVLASKATLRVEEILMDHAVTLEKINTVETADYDEDDRRQDKIVLYIQTASKMTKLYAPAVGVGMLAVACLTGSHHILTQRNTGLMAAYAALDKGFRAYRERVIADVGEDKDRQYRHGSETVTVGETKNGKPVVAERVSGDPSIYAKLWGRDYSNNWEPNTDYNMVFLRSQQNYFNDILQSRGHLFLNEVYAGLGLPHTKEGAIVGWIKGQGDDYVDLGIFNRQMQPQHFDFFTGHEEAIWLDPNVDGVMYDKI